MKNKKMFYIALGVSTIASAAAYIIIQKKKRNVEKDAQDGLPTYASKKPTKHLTPVFSRAKSYGES